LQGAGAVTGEAWHITQAVGRSLARWKPSGECVWGGRWIRSSDQG